MPAANPVDRETLLVALRACDWMIATTARRLGMTRQGVYYAMKLHAIHRRPVPARILSEAKGRKRAVA